jgi:hypothetical protein
MAAFINQVPCDGPHCRARGLTYPREECERVQMIDRIELFQYNLFCTNCFRHIQWIECCHVCHMWIEQRVGGKKLPTYIKHMGHLYCEDCLCDTNLDEDSYHIHHDHHEMNKKHEKILTAFKKGDYRDKVIQNIEKIIKYTKDTHALKEIIERDHRKQHIRNVTDGATWTTSLEQYKFILKLTEEQLDAISSDSKVCCMQTFLFKLVELK